jgi:bifunctional non-homologous end joining protein LigD
LGLDVTSAFENSRQFAILSKRRDRPYQGGRSKHWIKVKNRKHPASRIA